MAKVNPKLEALKDELRVVIDKVKTHYGEMSFESHGTVYYKNVRSATKSLITRVLNET